MYVCICVFLIVGGIDGGFGCLLKEGLVVVVVVEGEGEGEGEGLVCSTGLREWVIGL